MKIQLIAIAMLSVPAHGNAATCQDIDLNPALAQQYPNIRDNCLEIVSHEGREYMKQEARVMSAHRDGRVGLRFKKADGSLAKTVQLQAPPNFNVLIEGKPRQVGALSRGDTVQIYLLGRDANYYAANDTTGAPMNTGPATATYDPEPEPQATLAATAGSAPSFGVFGGVSLLLATLLAVVRKRGR